MPLYTASQIRYIGGDRRRVLGELIRDLFYGPEAPELLDLRVLYVGENEFLGVVKHADGREVDTRSGEYRIEFTFESKLDRRGAFELAEWHWGSITEGIIELEGVSAEEAIAGVAELDHPPMPEEKPTDAGSVMPLRSTRTLRPAGRRLRSRSWSILTGGLSIDRRARVTSSGVVAGVRACAYQLGTG